MTTISLSRAQTPLVVAIDVGSSSVRATLFDALGRSVDGHSVQKKYELHTAADGTSQDDPYKALKRVMSCIDSLLKKMGSQTKNIGAVGIDTFVSNIIGLDKHNRPVTPLITYADTRNNADSEQLRRNLDEREAHERTGCLLRTSYWPARLAWFRRTEPELWASVKRWVTIGEYLELELFGEWRVGYSVASWSGLLDRTTLRWDEPLLEHLDVSPDAFAPLVNAAEGLGRLREKYASRWPSLKNVPWYPAFGDGAVANVGSGCIGPKRIALTVGTTGAIRVALPAVEQVPAGLWCYRIDKELNLLGGATTEGGNVFAWLRSTLRLGSPEQIEAGIAALKPDSHGLTVLPFFAGERSPGWAGDVRATLSGFSFATRPTEIVRACLEQIACRFALIHQRLELPEQEHTMIASGSALLSSPTWMQIMADALGCTVVASAEHEATSRGAALMALNALGVLALKDAPTNDSDRYEPIAAHTAIYQSAIERQQTLYKEVIGR